MEQCCHNLKEFKENSPVVDEQTIKAIMRDMCTALSQIYKQTKPNQPKIVHLHIKPGIRNFLINLNIRIRKYPLFKYK